MFHLGFVCVWFVYFISEFEAFVQKVLVQFLDRRCQFLIRVKCHSTEVTTFEWQTMTQ